MIKKSKNNENKPAERTHHRNNVLFLLCLQFIPKGECGVVMEETPARLCVSSGGDDGTVVGLLVQEVAGSEDEFGAVLQELKADFAIQYEQVVVHRVGKVATIQIEVRVEGKSPLLEVIADV